MRGRIQGEYFENLDRAKEAAIDDAYNQDLVEYYYEGGEFRPEYQEFTMSGGTNYRELLIQFEGNEPYSGGHFSDEFAPGFAGDAESGTRFDNVESVEESDLEKPLNVLAHVRLKDRSINGEKVLSIEEIQSDYHKMRRKQGGGYQLPVYKRDVAKEEAKVKEAENAIEKMFDSGTVRASPLFRGLIKDLKATPDDPIQLLGGFTNAYRSIYNRLVDREDISDRLLKNINQTNESGERVFREDPKQFVLPVLSPETNKLLFQYRSAVNARDELLKNT